MTLYLPKTYASMEVDAHIEHMRHDRLEFSLYNLNYRNEVNISTTVMHGFAITKKLNLS